jgi:DNA-binding IclR family transcriptional regulator
VVSGGRTSDPPSVASRLLAILGTFTATHAELSLAQISRRAGLAASTTHRLVRELCEWGALERDERGIYRIGPRLRELARLQTR